MTGSGAVLWYVHDQGSGHLQRARSVIPLLHARAVVACGPGIACAAREVLTVPVVALPSDTPRPALPTVGPWHHAPASPQVRARSAVLAATMRANGCTTAVVDVSMEVAAMTRLMGLRVVALRQSGSRDDDAHRIGFDSADVVWVPQSRTLEPIGGPIDERWCFTGAFSRFDSLAPPPSPCSSPRGLRLVVLMVGRGGHGLDVEQWRRTRPPAGWRVVIVGTDAVRAGCGVDVVGRVDSILPLLEAAEVVVTSAGWSAVADVVSTRRRLVVVPETRPFGEQSVRARTLAAAGLAIALDGWPTPDRLPSVVEAAVALEPGRWDEHYDRRGAVRSAAMIDELHAS